jgi:hypothetical protein
MPIPRRSGAGASTGDQLVAGPAVTIAATSNAPINVEQVYDRRRHEWNKSYVVPSEYRLGLNMTRVRPTPANPLNWRVESLENRFPPIDLIQTGIEEVIPGRRGVIAKLPAAGPVRVSVTGRGQPRTNDVNLKDYLVVSIGDSYASGQGNPDQDGVPTVGSSAICEATTLVALVERLHAELKEIPVVGDWVSLLEGIVDALVDLVPSFGDGGFIHMDPGPVWSEPLAWRSLKSAPSLAAQAAELRGRARLTTFVSVAQSGAEIDAGLLKPQRAFRPFGQIDEVFEMLRDPRDHRTPPRRLLRPVDVLVMSIGGNDVGFSGTLSDMTTEKVAIGMLWETGATQREIRARIRAELADLPAKYDKLDGVIRDRLDPKAVLIPEYPTALFDGADGQPAAGCGLFDITGPQGVSRSDAQMIEELGNDLNTVIREAAARNDWTVATDIARQFESHGYCSGQSFFVFAEESCNRQDDLEGTMHPNRTGTGVVAKRLQEELTTIFNRLDSDATAGVRRPPRIPAPAGGG